MSKPETMMLDDVKYIRADTVNSEPLSFDGMDYCIVRSREQGVMCGYVKSVNGRSVELLQARQIYRYDSKFVLADVAEYGMKNSGREQLSVAMSQPMLMLEACGIYTCTGKSADNLISIKAQEK